MAGMANLVPCPSCDHEVSPEASSCPKCGHPLRSLKRPIQYWLGAFLSLSAIILLLGWLVFVGLMFPALQLPFETKGFPFGVLPMILLVFMGFCGVWAMMKNAD